MKTFNQYLLENTLDANTMSKGEIYDLIDRMVDYIDNISLNYNKFFAKFPEKQWEEDKELALNLGKSNNPNLTPKEKRRIKDIVEEDALEPGFEEADKYYDPDEPDSNASEETVEYHRKKGWIDELWRRLYNDIEVAEHIIKKDPKQLDNFKDKFPELAKKHSHIDMGNKFGAFDGD